MTKKIQTLISKKLLLTPIILTSIIVISIITIIILFSINAKNGVIDDTEKNTSIVTQEEFESLSYNLIVKRMIWEGDGNTNQTPDRQSTGFYITAINEDKNEKYIAYYEDFWPEQNKNGKKDTVKVGKRRADKEEIESAKNAYQEYDYKSFKELINELVKDDYEYVTE